MICQECKSKRHTHCPALVRQIAPSFPTTGVANVYVEREQPSPTHCDCQHRTGDQLPSILREVKSSPPHPSGTAA